MNTALPINQVLMRFGKFAFVGLFATAIHYSILTFLVEACRTDVVLATTVGFVAAAIVNYALNRRFTFESDAKHRVALPKFLTVATLGAAMNAGVVAWFGRYTNAHYLVAQICATSTVLLWNFSINAIWTFRKLK